MKNINVVKFFVSFFLVINIPLIMGAHLTDAKDGAENSQYTEIEGYTITNFKLHLNGGKGLEKYQAIIGQNLIESGMAQGTKDISDYCRKNKSINRINMDDYSIILDDERGQNYILTPEAKKITKRLVAISWTITGYMLKPILTHLGTLKALGFKVNDLHYITLTYTKNAFLKK